MAQEFFYEDNSKYFFSKSDGTITSKSKILNLSVEQLNELGFATKDIYDLSEEQVAQLLLKRALSPETKFKNSLRYKKLDAELKELIFEKNNAIDYVDFLKRKIENLKREMNSHSEEDNI
jgi:hypothetical protein